jgi:hypothetical protein
VLSQVWLSSIGKIPELCSAGEDKTLLWKLTESPTILLRRCFSTRTETAILDFEKSRGLLANLALGEKVEEILQRYGRVDENLQGLYSDEKAMLPLIESIRKGIHDFMSRLVVPAKITWQDVWVGNISSVPSPPPYAEGTQYLHYVYSALLDDARRRRVIAMHGWGGSGKSSGLQDDIKRNKMSSKESRTGSYGQSMERRSRLVRSSNDWCIP